MNDDPYKAFKCRTCHEWLVPSNPESQNDTCCCVCPNGHGRIVHGPTARTLKDAMKKESEEREREKMAQWVKTLPEARRVSMRWAIVGVSGLFARLGRLKPFDTASEGNLSASIDGAVFEFRPARLPAKAGK